MPALAPFEQRPSQQSDPFGPTLAEVWAADGLVAKVTAAGQWWQHCRVGRGLNRYSLKRGNLLAGGISFVALFSLTAGLVVGWTVFMAVLGGNADLKDSVLDAINDAMPGLLRQGDGSGLIDPDSLVRNSPFTLTGIVALVLALLSASKVMTALKMSLWSMFGVVRLPDNAVMGKLRDFLGFLGLATGVILTAALGIVANALGSFILDAVSLDGAGARLILSGVSLLISFAVDMVLFAFLIRIVAGMRVPARDLWIGSAFFALGSGLIRWLGTSAVGAVDDPILATGAAVITLMLWINLVARIVLMVAAWIANPPFALMPKDVKHLHGADRPNYVTMSEPSTLEWPHHTMTGDVEPDPRYDPDGWEIVFDSATWNSSEVVWLRRRIDRAQSRADRFRRRLWTLGTHRQIRDRDW